MGSMSLAQAPAVEKRSRASRMAASTARGLDRARILAKLQDLRARQSDTKAFRKAAVFLLQAELTVARAEARKALEAGGTGRACAEALSAQMDDLLRIALDLAARWLAPAPGRDPLPTIVAVGGYGRGMLAPFSDVDLLFLLPARTTPAVEKIVEALLYV